MTDPVLYEAKEGIANIFVNRPETANAVNSEVMAGLADALNRAATDEDVRVVILSGTGERSFVSGGDLNEFHEILQTSESVYQKFSEMKDNLYRIATFPKPVIAAINGAARGGGGELAAACHFRIAAETATIGFVQVNLGISTGWGGASLLARAVGYQKALRLILTGEILSAAKAKEISLFDEVVPQGQLWPTVQSFAKEIASHSPAAVQGILKMMGQTRDLRLEEAMDLESRLCASLWESEEHVQAVDDFLKRRKH